MSSNQVLSPLAGLEGAWQHTRLLLLSTPQSTAKQMRQALGLGWGHPQELGPGLGAEKVLYFRSAVGRLGDLSALWMISWNVSDG